MKVMQNHTSVGTIEVEIIGQAKFEVEMREKYANSSNKNGLTMILDTWFKLAKRSSWKNQEDIKREKELFCLEIHDKYMVFDLGNLDLENSLIPRYVLLVTCTFRRNLCVIFPKDILTIEEYRLRYKKQIPI